MAIQYDERNVNIHKGADFCSSLKHKSNSKDTMAFSRHSHNDEYQSSSNKTNTSNKYNYCYRICYG